MWSRVFRELATSEHLSIAESARFFASLYVTAADALISAWVDKRHYLFWRPITAIRLANTDGNPVTTANPSRAAVAREPAVPGPPLGPREPERIDRGDAATVLRHGRHGVRSHERRDEHHAHVRPLLRGDRRDRGRSVWSGIHFRAADVQAARLGRQVSLYVAEHEFGRR